ncbi:hypothetical protein KHQ84_gp023 [Rhodococcus phage Finch]|uniref:Head fiber protein n=1 Tax=Rhodococcus phage Finch TaxID=2094144 RepID=A0A2P1JXB5_9CAUD|nr:hypothetical protein KHQ84_gp023 [Rhodococcus phage Finch]AVO24968.1 hypothetical protein SEA_FINCH_23 [Rhodococcus phage Finch]
MATLYVRNETSTPITANAIGAARFELSAKGQRGDNKVLPLSVANLPGFQRIWAATPARVTVATDPAFSNVVTSIPSEAGGPTAWNDITSKPAVIAAGATQAAARTAIGAVTVGTTATDAKAGNYTPPNATTSVKGLVNQAATQANFAGADAAAIVGELNAFLGKLKTAGIVA